MRSKPLLPRLRPRAAPVEVGRRKSDSATAHRGRVCVLVLVLFVFYRRPLSGRFIGF
jgi:hypothetical protein